MAVHTFESLKDLHQWEADEGREKHWSDFHKTAPAPAHMVRRQLESAILRGRHRWGGSNRYGLKAQIQELPSEIDGLACFVAEEVPFHFVTHDGLKFLAPVELEIRQLSIEHPLHTVLANARRVDHDHDHGAPYNEGLRREVAENEAMVEDMQREDLDRAMRMTDDHVHVGYSGRR